MTLAELSQILFALESVYDSETARMIFVKILKTVGDITL